MKRESARDANQFGRLSTTKSWSQWTKSRSYAAVCEHHLTTQSGNSSGNDKMERCVCKANIFVSNGWDLENMGNTQRKYKLLFPFLHWNTSGYGFVLKITACCYTLISPLTTTSWDTFSRASDIVHFTIESWIFKYSGTHKNKNEFLIHR